MAGVGAGTALEWVRGSLSGPAELHATHRNPRSPRRAVALRCCCCCCCCSMISPCTAAFSAPSQPTFSPRAMQMRPPLRSGARLQQHHGAGRGGAPPQLGNPPAPHKAQPSSSHHRCTTCRGVYAVGFIARPVGALLFGHVGDTAGRRTSLLWSMAAIAIPTVLIGCLPTYGMIGDWAPAMLAVLRAMQGLALGGEYGTAQVRGAHAAPLRRLPPGNGHSRWRPLLLGVCFTCSNPHTNAARWCTGRIRSTWLPIYPSLRCPADLHRRNRKQGQGGGGGRLRGVRRRSWHPAGQRGRADRPGGLQPRAAAGLGMAAAVPGDGGQRQPGG